MNGCASAPRAAGARTAHGTFERITRDADGTAVVAISHAADGAARRPPAALFAPARSSARTAPGRRWRGNAVPGADTHPLRRRLSRDRARTADRQGNSSRQPAATCITRGNLSPDFYAWVFPHGATASVGVAAPTRDSRCAGHRRVARRERARGADDPAARGGAHTHEASGALGQRPRRGARRRCRRAWSRPRSGRGHLLRDGRRALRRGGVARFLRAAKRGAHGARRTS